MTECFDCDNCKESLYGRKYIQMDNGPYCIPCYDAHFANTCDECKELIGHDCRVSTGPVLSITGSGCSSPTPPHLAVLPRSCTTRIATTTSTASAASAATARWPTSPSPARMRSCCATTATAASSPPSASPARRRSCQVGADRGQGCGLLKFQQHWMGLQAPVLEQQGRGGFLPSCCTVRAQHRLGAVWQDSRMPRCDQHSPVCLLPFFFFLWGSETGRK